MFGFIETMVFHISTPWVLLRPWFPVYSPCEYYSDHGFPKSTVIAAIQPMASIRQERVFQEAQSKPAALLTLINSRTGQGKKCFKVVMQVLFDEVFECQPNGIK